MNKNIILISVLMFLPMLVSADVGIGLRETVEEVVFNSNFDSEEKCIFVGVYNPFDTDVSGVVVSENLNLFLTKISPEEVFVKRFTNPADSIPVSICFKNDFFDLPEKFFLPLDIKQKGSVLVKAKPIGVGFGSAVGSIVQLPFTVVINKSIIDWIIIVLFYGLVGFGIYKLVKKFKLKKNHIVPEQTSQETEPKENQEKPQG